jgi:hypothetical protein
MSQSNRHGHVGGCRVSGASATFILIGGLVMIAAAGFWLLDEFV